MLCLERNSLGSTPATPSAPTASAGKPGREAEVNQMSMVCTLHLCYIHPCSSQPSAVVLQSGKPFGTPGIPHGTGHNASQHPGRGKKRFPFTAPSHTGHSNYCSTARLGRASDPRQLNGHFWNFWTTAEGIRHFNIPGNSWKQKHLS